MSDVEKGYPAEDVRSNDYDSKAPGVIEGVQVSKWQSFKDSFKPADLSQYDTTGMTEEQKVALAVANSPLQKRLKNRHLQMIAIGGSIGTGLFVGSGKVLSTGGPAALLIGFALIGSMLFCTVQALGEMAVMYPVSGAFAVYASRFIDPAWGFAMGWNYGCQWLVVLPVELIAASITIDFWQSGINNAAWVAIFYVLIMCINMFGVRGYGEAEFIFSLVKVIAVVGFIILGIVLVCGGGPGNEGYIGGKYWHDPGAFAHGFKGVCAVFVTAAFAFTGTELAGLAAAETQNPRKTLPKAVKQVFWRILIFYIVSLLLVGLLVPYDDPRLLSASGSADAKASPFVIAIQNAGIGGLPSVINVVVMIAVLSVGNSCVYACSRTLASLASQKLAPKWLGYIDRKGRPMGGILLCAIFGLLSFLCASDKQEEVFAWLMALTGLSSILTWGSICLCHIRFRYAMRVQNRSLDEIPFKSQVGVIGSYYGLVMNCLVLVAQFWIALFPIGGSPDPSAFFQAYLAAPIFLVCLIGMKLIGRTKWANLKTVDLDTGRRITDVNVLIEQVREEEAAVRARGRLFRIYHFWC